MHKSLCPLPRFLNPLWGISGVGETRNNHNPVRQVFAFQLTGLARTRSKRRVTEIFLDFS